MNAKDFQYIHIPKCAGTSVAELGKLINKNWGQHDPDFKDLKWLHHTPLMYKPKKTATRYFTILREPKDRLISELIWHHRENRSLGINFSRLMEGSIKESNREWQRLKNRLLTDQLIYNLVTTIVSITKIQLAFNFYALHVRDRVLPGVGWGHFIPQTAFIKNNHPSQSKILICQSPSHFEDLFSMTLPKSNSSNKDHEIVYKVKLDSIITFSDVKRLYRNDITLFQLHTKQ